MMENYNTIERELQQISHSIWGTKQLNISLNQYEVVESINISSNTAIKIFPM